MDSKWDLIVKLRPEPFVLIVGGILARYDKVRK